MEAFPAILLSFIIFFLPFFEGGALPRSLFIVHSLLFLSLLALGIGALRGKREAFAIPRITICFIPFVLYFLLRTLLSPYLYASFLSLWEVLMFCLAFCLAACFSQTKECKWIVLWSMLLSGAGQAVLAILFFFLGGFRRSAVYFLNPNHLAAYLLMAFFAGSLIFIELRKGGVREQRLSRVVSVFLVLILASFILGSSRGALISFICAFLFLLFFLFLQGKRRESLVVAIVLVIVVIAGLFLVYLRFRGGFDIYRYERIRIWKASLGLFLDHPFFGIGPGMFEYYSLNYDFPQLDSPVRYGRYFSTPHSDLVLSLAELGIIGSLLLFIPIVYILWLFFARRRAAGESSGGESYSASSMVLLVILVSFLTQSLFDNLSARPALYMSLALIAGSLGVRMKGESLFEVRFLFLRRGYLFFLCFLVPMVYLYHLAVFSPFLSDLFIKRSQQLVAEKRESDALKYCDRAIFFNPIHPDYFNLRGTIRMELLKEGKLKPEYFPSLDEDFMRASDLNPKEASYLVNRAKLSEEMISRGLPVDDLYRNAVEMYTIAEEVSSKVPFISYELAHLFYERGNLRDAERECLKSLSIEPYFFQASLLLAQIYSDRGETEQAKGIIGKMEKQFKEIDGYRVQNKYEFHLLNYDRNSYLKLREILVRESVPHQ